MVVNNKGMPCINLTEEEKEDLKHICNSHISRYDKVRVLLPKQEIEIILAQKVIDKLCR